MQADTLLNEAFASQCRITGFDTNRGASAGAVEEFIAVEYRLHSKLRQELTIEGAGQIEPAHRQDDVGHAVNFDHARFIRFFKPTIELYCSQSLGSRPVAEASYRQEIIKPAFVTEHADLRQESQVRSPSRFTESPHAIEILLMRIVPVGLRF